MPGFQQQQGLVSLHFLWLTPGFFQRASDTEVATLKLLTHHYHIVLQRTITVVVK